MRDLGFLYEVYENCLVEKTSLNKCKLLHSCCSGKKHGNIYHILRVVGTNKGNYFNILCTVHHMGISLWKQRYMH